MSPCHQWCGLIHIDVDVLQHDELVLMLIQLRREQAAEENVRNFLRQRLEERKPAEQRYRLDSLCRLRQTGGGPVNMSLEEDHNEYIRLKHQLEEVENRVCIGFTDPAGPVTSFVRNLSLNLFVIFQCLFSFICSVFQLEVYRPLVSLVHNMVNMGSLYGGDNYMMASQYRKVSLYILSLTMFYLVLYF